MNWNYLISPGCFLLGVLITLFARDSARTVAKEEFREQIGAALSVFKLDLLEALDRRYRLRAECILMMESQDRQEQKGVARMNAQDRHIEFIDHELEKGQKF